MQEIINHCSYLLYNCPQAEDCLSYLDKRINREIQQKFGFGYFPSNDNINLLIDFISNNNLIEHDLAWSLNISDSQNIQNKTIYFFENHPLIMPYRDVYGDIIGLVGRSLLPDNDRPFNVPKYKNTEFKKGNHLFGLFEAKQSILELDFVYVVEGQFDVIKAFEKGIKNIVALGSANMTARQISLLSRYTNNIIMLLDADNAGENGRERVKKKFGSLINLSIDQYLPDQYKDIDDFLDKNNELFLIKKQLII